MNRTPSWRELIPGLVITGLLAGTAIFVVAFARVGQLRGSTIELTVLAPSAVDVAGGTEVWLAGQRVGLVSEVRLRPPSTDTLYRVAIVTKVLTRAAPLIRTDALADVRRGETILGAQVVAIGPGSAGARSVTDGDTILVRIRPGLDEFRDQLGPAIRSVPALRRELEAIRTSTTANAGTIGALMHSGEIARTRQLVQRFRSVMGGATAGRGAIAGVMQEDSELRRGARQATARVDSIRQLLDSDQGTLGRFRRDTTLQLQMAAVQAEVDSIRALLDQPAGTAGRALHDEILQAQLDSASLQLRVLSDDVRRRPLRYIQF